MPALRRSSETTELRGWQVRALSALAVSPRTVRQLFNDTDADALWLVVGAPASDRPPFTHNEDAPRVPLHRLSTARGTNATPRARRDRQKWQALRQCQGVLSIPAPARDAARACAS